MLFILLKTTQNCKKVLRTLLYIWGGGNIKDLILLKVASKELGISYKTLYSWVKNNEVSYTKVGNRYYLSSEQLNSLVFVFTKSRN